MVDWYLQVTHIMVKIRHKCRRHPNVWSRTPWHLRVTSLDFNRTMAVYRNAGAIAHWIGLKNTIVVRNIWVMNDLLSSLQGIFCSRIFPVPLFEILKLYLIEFVVLCTSMIVGQLSASIYSSWIRTHLNAFPSKFISYSLQYSVFWKSRIR